jgi:HAD superfamily, subfamily IIIB (Acid phosphatase)
VRRLAPVLALLAAAAFAAGAAVAADPPTGAVEYQAAGGLFTGVKPTAVGLPQIGASGTIGASDMVNQVQKYHDSGAYDADLTAVAQSARNYLAARVGERKPVKQCRIRYKRVKVSGSRTPLYRRGRACKLVTPPAPSGKPAIVLDIDETSLSNYSGLLASGFSAVGTVVPAATGQGTAIAPVLDLYRDARNRGVAVFFITGRPSAIKSVSEDNLKNVGYDRGWEGTFFKPGDQGTEAFKAGTRADIEKQGYEILANVGDQESDLDGGHADRAFKLPNPFYFIPD